MAEYNPREIEPKWQEAWSQANLYNTDTADDGSKHFALVEFPYPSGNLHVGHWYAFSVPDIRARYLRMKGYNVLFPVGFDSFGLPAENAAIKHGKDPKVWTDSNIDYMKGQLRRMGAMFDWDRLVQTSDPSFYRWTQWMFARFYKKGLVYRDSTLVNWCPSCQTVLANEQVVNGECERCGQVVEKKTMAQWMLRITQYADELIDNLDTLDWPQEIKEAQRNWIGRSEGAELYFEVNDNQKLHFVLVHGYEASPDLNFHPWLKTELEKRGHTVEVPKLPNPNSPDVREQAQYVLDNCRIDETTVLLGHSLGTNVTLRILEQLDTPVHRTVLVGGFVDDNFAIEKKRDVKLDFAFDTEKITTNAGELVLLHGENEETITKDQFNHLHRVFGGRAILGQDVKEHFRGQEEPAVLRAALSSVPVFTTRPDTLMGTTYLVVAPEHALVESWKSSLGNTEEVISYQKQAAAKTDLDRQQSKEKTGVQLEGVEAIHPITGKKLPIWIADYVLAGYGTGAIMAVPAHDERDFAFAEKFNLPIVDVITKEESSDTTTKELYTGTGTLIHSGDFNDMSSEEAKIAITKAAGGRLKTTYKQRDWGISRQRYWGTPIPIVYDPEGNPHVVPDEHLPWLLPTDVDYTPDGTAPLARSEELKARTERIFGAGWTPEVDTMDAFVDSTWYFMRYLDPSNTEAFASREVLANWLPVDMYSGGSEHTTMHVLYSRFWYKALADLQLVPGREPYKMRMNRGLIMGPDGKKMSKSKGNVVDPDVEVERFGADSLRIYLAFIGPYNEIGHYPWNTDGLAGVRRFLEKVWRVAETIEDASNPELDQILHATLKKVGDDLELFKTNTAVAQLMTCATQLDRAKKVGKDQFAIFLCMLAPFAPHITEELWSTMDKKGFIHQEKWPIYDESLLVLNTVTIAVQVNGKLRATLEFERGADRETITEKALSNEVVIKYVPDKEEIKKIIVVPDKLINIVV